jgi:hypothetical protein
MQYLYILLHIYYYFTTFFKNYTKTTLELFSIIKYFILFTLLHPLYQSCVLDALSIPCIISSHHGKTVLIHHHSRL